MTPSISDNPAPAQPVDEPSVEERRALIERVAASQQFSRSTRLRDFLLYVGKRSLRDGSAEIHEQEIGSRVFGRPATYDRSQDNIVRVNATELRKRIESYFTSTGAQEPLIFEIPRGCYKPVFRRRIAEAAGQPELPREETPQGAAPAPEAETPATKHSRWLAWMERAAWPLASLSLAVACGVLVQQNRAMQKALHPWESQPAVAAFWTGFLDPHRQTDIVLPDDSASVIEDITNIPISLGDYMNGGYIRRTQEAKINADREEDIYQIFNHNLVTFGGVRAAQLVLGEIPPTYPHYLAMTRYFTADEIKRDNVVLVGGKKSVPWDYLFDDQLNFVTDYDYAHSVQFVRDRHPRTGEQAIYAVPAGPNSLVGYTVIAYLPNLSGSGSVIILAGTDSDATAAAAGFLTAEDKMERFRNILHVKRFPYFEALLKTSRLSGTFFDANLIAYRTHPGQH